MPARYRACGMRISISYAALALSLAACALTARPVEQTLGHDAAAAPSLAELDAATKDAVAASDAAPSDLRLLVAAARWLFLAADLRLQRATVAALAAQPNATRKQVLGAADLVTADERTAILSLATAGLGYAERAVTLQPSEAAARLHVALHLSLVAWANGAARSIVAGFGPKLVQAIDAALALDREGEGGAALRLQGRFRSQAPWPYSDLKLARESLARAVELAGNPVNHLFYGDALAASGDAAAAEQQWRLAALAKDDSATRWSGAALRELAQRRLAAH